VVTGEGNDSLKKKTRGNSDRSSIPTATRSDLNHWEARTYRGGGYQVLVANKKSGGGGRGGGASPMSFGVWTGVNVAGEGWEQRERDEGG